MADGAAMRLGLAAVAAAIVVMTALVACGGAAGTAAPITAAPVARATSTSAIPLAVAPPTTAPVEFPKVDSAPVPILTPVTLLDITATPTTSATSEPTTDFTVESRALDLADWFESPNDCSFRRVSMPQDVILSYRFECAERAPLRAPAAGRIVANRQTRPLVAPSKPYPGWEWATIAGGSALVAIDHGPLATFDNLTSVLVLASTAADLPIGTRVDAGEVLGDETSGQWLLWTSTDEGEIAKAQTAQSIADILAPRFVSPVSESCRVDFVNAAELPNALRTYRNGVHAGIDFICSNKTSTAHAAFDGTIVEIVSDYLDPSPNDRGAVLANASRAQVTPRWTLNMLYGNHVVIRHDVPGIDEPLHTISAHLADVTLELQVGQAVVAGALLGQVGNSGTSVAAAGGGSDTDRSLHLHWEIHVGNRYLGAGLQFQEMKSTYERLLCGNDAGVSGCSVE